jgi:alpha-tubulin suppressor-like RCC1 family protein
VAAWGANSSGQLGNNSTTNSTSAGLVDGPGGSGTLSNVTAVAAGTGFSLALTSSGNVYAWGDNSSDELGNGTSTESNVPVEVEGVGGSGFLSNVTAITAGSNTGMALTSAGNVYTWGYGHDGELGNGTTPTYSPTPVEVEGSGGSGFLSGVTAIAGGGFFMEALTSSGNVWTWGKNSAGELGDDSTTNSSTPVEVEGVGGSGDFSGVTAIGAGIFTGYLISSGDIYSWGDDSYGELGNNTAGDIPSTTPVETVVPTNASGPLSATAIVGGLYSALALMSDDSVWAWGDNTDGQLGDTTTTQRQFPVLVRGVGGVTALGAGPSAQHALVAAAPTSPAPDAVEGWGENLYGQTGDDTTLAASQPVTVAGLSNVTSVTSGGTNSYALTSVGNVYAWGENLDGALGNNSTTDSNVPVEVDGVSGSGFLSGVTAIAAGNKSGYALTSAGNVYAWGYNADGELGNNSSTESNVPVEVEGAGGLGFL